MPPFESICAAGGTGVRLQRVMDELATLEHQLVVAWPDAEQIDSALAAGRRELSRLRAEVRELDGPQRLVDFALVGTCAALAVFVVGVMVLFGGVP